MPRLQSTPRTRVVNFRLTQQEYEEILSACQWQGARCLSEFARSALLQFARSGAVLAPSAQRRLLRLDERLGDLNAALARLMEVLGTGAPAPTRQGRVADRSQEPQR